jgi:hypothetical protein
MDWLEEMHEVYGQAGLRVVGVHTPEFSFAADREYVQWRVKRRRMKIPVLVDSEKQNWEAFANRAWPSYWLVSGDGYVVGEWVGEGKERAIEEAVRALLRYRGDLWALNRVELMDLSCLPTTEWYAGFRAWENGQIVDAPPVIEEEALFLGGEPSDSGYALIGRWKADKESWVAASPGARILVQPQRARLGVVAGYGKLAWSSVLSPREEMVIDRPQFMDLGLVLPGEVITLELEPHRTRIYSLVQSFG